MGTTNQLEFLTDSTGNRSFWSVERDRSRRSLNIWEDFSPEYREQVITEMVATWRDEEKLYLSPEEENLVKVTHRGLAWKEWKIII